MKIAIQGHSTRGKEVIQILESLGGKNIEELEGIYSTFYYINDKNEIMDDHRKNFPLTYKFYTLEEFEKEFPFKVGDNVQIEIDNTIYLAIITDIVDIGKYKVKYLSGSIGFIDKKDINIYNKMNTRNITLTLEKAKEWYKKGGELKEVALQAFTEKELNPLPRSWEEFCKQGNPIASWRYNIPIKYQALFKLEQLRDCWRQGWKPNEYNVGYAIFRYPSKYIVISFSFKSFLSFPTEKMAEEFLECFGDLIELAGDLI